MVVVAYDPDQSAEGDGRKCGGTDVRVEFGAEKGLGWEGIVGVSFAASVRCAYDLHSNLCAWRSADEGESKAATELRVDVRCKLSVRVSREPEEEARDGSSDVSTCWKPPSLDLAFCHELHRLMSAIEGHDSDERRLETSKKIRQPLQSHAMPISQQPV